MNIPPHFRARLLRAYLVSLLTIFSLYGTHPGSHTFFTPRSITTDSTFELALSNYQNYRTWEHEKYQLFVKPFFQQTSFRDHNNLANYFMIHNSADIREDGSGDIGSLWLNLIGPEDAFYSSTICFKPKRQAFGGVLTFFADIGNSCVETLWLSINTAVMGARHMIGLEEKDRAVEGTLEGLKNACDAFNNPDWNAGKIDCCRWHSKGGLDDIQVKIGHKWWHTPKAHIADYLALVVPTGARPTSEFLFEPLVGSRHFQLGFGLNADHTMNVTDLYSMYFMIDFKFLYAFAGTEKRSFDLKNNGNGSRYLLVAGEKERLSTLPGINLFTLPVQVTPGSSLNLWAAFHLETRNNWHVEVGYNLWYRQAEKIKLLSDACRCPLENEGGIKGGFGIFDLARIHDPQNVTSASTANISQGLETNQPKSDGTFVELTSEDLDLKSAAHPAALTNKLYGAISYDTCVCDYPVVLGIASSYEFAGPCGNALEQWAVWGVLGIGF